MIEGKVWKMIFRNLLGLLALFLIHFSSDYYYFNVRTGFRQLSPYLFLLGLYGWIAFHNVILFAGLYLNGRKTAYFLWTLLCMVVSSVNYLIILIYLFDAPHPLPHILSFWVYTFAGLGVFMVYRQLFGDQEKVAPVDREKLIPQDGAFGCTIDGLLIRIPFSTILYIESLENYVRIFTTGKTYLTRLSMKEAEDKLPQPDFIRISRYHIVNTLNDIVVSDDAIVVNQKSLKIGKVYKKYVAERFAR